MYPRFISVMLYTIVDFITAYQNPNICMNMDNKITFNFSLVWPQLCQYVSYGMEDTLKIVQCGYEFNLS